MDERDGAAPTALLVVDKLSRWAIVGLMAAMIAVVSIQVALRYALSASMDFAEELSRLCFVWAVFLAIPHGVPQAGHVGIDLLVAKLPDPLRRTLARAIALASAVLMGVVGWFSAVAAADSWDQLMPTLDLSSGWFYVAVCVGAAHSALHLMALALRAPATIARGGRS
jgi:TRAP-type C4-dicarboxylate transport system permease small subunit